MTSITFTRPVGRAFSLLATAIGALGSAVAAAQTPPPPPPDAGAIEEVVVTAQKRAESLQTVPVSVTALTASQLGELKFDTPSDLATQIPNLQVGGVNGEGSPIFSLRGVSMFDYSLNQSSPVASYINEVYKGNVVLFGVELYDLERIEVLRGPQGTLYGKNSTGGAINFITHKPGFDTEGDIKLGTGNYGREEAEGAFQTALVPDKLALRVAGTYTKVDGFMRNLLPGHPDMEGVDQYGLRVSLLYRINEDAKATLVWSKSKQYPVDYAIIAGNIAPGGIFGAGYYRTVDMTATGTPLANDQVQQNYTPHRQQENQAAALTVNWQLDPKLALTSITSWDLGSLFNPDNTDGAPFDYFKIPYFGKTRQVTQDLRVTSSTGGPFEYIVGAYYQHEVIYDSTENQIGNVFDINGDNVFNYQDCAASSYNAAGGYVGLINAGCRYYNQFDQIRNSWAVYSDGSYALSPLFKLRAGVRYTHENASQENALNQLRGSDEVPIANVGFFTTLPDGSQGPVLALPGSPNYDAIVGQTRGQSLHNTAVTGHAGLDYTPTKDALLYIGYSRGYRAGAFNAQFLFSPTDFSTVQPETVDSIEGGFKTAWLENRLQFNGAIFTYQYKNQQIIDVQPTGRQPLINLPKSKITGGELEVVSRPVRVLTLRLGLGFLDATIQEGSIQGGTVPVNGHQLPQAPHTSGTIAADWDAFGVASARVVLHVDASYASKQFFELYNEDRIAQDSYGLVNARVSVRGDKWEVGAWGKNLADKFYLTNAYDLQALGFDYLHRGLPRMYGIDASYHF